jgi:hypothetical protein
MSLVPFFPFVILFFAFPIYFCFNFIFLLLNKDKYSKQERKLLLMFYGIPSLLFLFIGVIFKIMLYRKYYGGYFLNEFYYYYFLENGKIYFISIFVSLILVFFISYIVKEGGIFKKKRENIDGIVK